MSKAKELIEEMLSESLKDKMEGSVTDLTPQSLDREYRLLPKEFQVLKPKQKVHLHMHRNADYALENPSGGMNATVKEVYKSGLKLKLNAAIVNNKFLSHSDKGPKVKLDDNERYVFVTWGKAKGKALNGYIAHVDTRNVNSGEVIIGSMSSSAID